MAVYESFRPRGVLMSRRLVLHCTVLLHKDKHLCDLVQKSVLGAGMYCVNVHGTECVDAEITYI